MTRTGWIGVAAGVAVLLLVAWIASKTTWENREERLPLRGEARTNPFYAAQRFAEALGATTRWEHALGEIAPDAVVVVSSLHWSLLPSRRQALERWVEAGGRLVVDDQLLTTEDFSKWSGIERDYPEDDADEAEDSEELAIPDRCRDFVQAGAAARYKVCEFQTPSWLTSRHPLLWSLRDRRGMQAARVKVGRGTVTMINASPFTTARFLEGDHARLFAAATQLRRRDEVHFISENERPSLLALVWRHGSPVVLLAAVWLALSLWRGGVRLGPVAPVPEAARRSLAEQIRGTAHFAIRMGDAEPLHAAVRRALLDTAQRRITGFQALDDGARAAAIARMTGFDATALSAAMTIVDYRRLNELRSAIALLESARRQLQIRSTGRSHGTE